MLVTTMSLPSFETPSKLTLNNVAWFNFSLTCLLNNLISFISYEFVIIYLIKYVILPKIN